MSFSGLAGSVLARWMATVMLVTARPHAVDSPVNLRIIEDVTDGAGPASEARVVAQNSQRLAVGWCSQDANSAGIYIRRRNAFSWDADPVKFQSPPGANPR